jgi:5-carboxymethyl-2-hydroxymuconate isomerase
MVVDEPHDVGKLRMQTRVNGETRQDSTTAEMVYSFGDCVEHLSDYVELLPGDMLVSGTPAGTAIESGPDGPYLQPGDEVAVEIEGVGVLRTVVGAPADGIRRGGR